MVDTSDVNKTFFVKTKTKTSTFTQDQDQDQDFSRTAELLNLSWSQNKQQYTHTDVCMYYQSFC